MTLALQFKIKNDPNLYRYLRENSHWYKELNRDPSNISLMEEEMKEKYKLRPTDKINKISEQLKLIRAFMDMVAD